MKDKSKKKASSRNRKAPDHTVATSLGVRLRKLRLERGFSLAKLAKEVEITGGLISQVENGKADPSFNTLRKIANALNVPMFYLFVDQPEKTKVRTSTDRFRLDTQDGGVSYQFISNPNDGQVEFTTTRAAPGYGSGEGMDSHPGQECALIIKGRMRLQLESKCYELKRHESITFNSFRPHRWENVGQGELQFISVASLPYLS